MTARDHVPVIIADSVTKIAASDHGAVLVAASHGGAYAAYVAAEGGVRGVILNDAGIGKDRAGLGCLALFDGLGRPAATVDYLSARIGDGNDMMARGKISYVNDAAAALGCAPGQSTADAAARMQLANLEDRPASTLQEGRYLLAAEPGQAEVWGLDSASLVLPDDTGKILVTGSHGGLLAGNPDFALRADPIAAVFNDAGVGIDDAGIGRLPVLARRGVAAATVAARSARIGDAQSAWETGVISHLNDPSRRLGAAVGMTCQQYVAAIQTNVNESNQ